MITRPADNGDFEASLTDGQSALAATVRSHRPRHSATFGSGTAASELRTFAGSRLTIEHIFKAEPRSTK
jgi:hypothetical protein